MSSEPTTEEVQNLSEVSEQTEQKSRNAVKRDLKWDQYLDKRSSARKAAKERKRAKREAEIQALREANGGELPPRPPKDGSYTVNEEYPFKYVERHNKLILERIQRDEYVNISRLNELYRVMSEKRYSTRTQTLDGQVVPIHEAFPEFFTPTPEVEEQSAKPHYNCINPGKPSYTPNIVIDCSHENVMQDSEIYSLVKQLAYCYGSTSRAITPCKLGICGIKPGSLSADQLSRYEGSQTWLWNISEKDLVDYVQDISRKQEDAEYQENYDKMLETSGEHETSAEEDTKPAPYLLPSLEDVIYLTAESDNVIEEIDPTKTYVIGGIVDHNRLKGYAHEYATTRGIKTARLPLDKYMNNGKRSVLTIVNVAELLLARQHLEWKEAMISILPKRWKWQEKIPTDGDGDTQDTQ